MKKNSVRRLDKVLLAVVGSAIATAVFPTVTWAGLTMNHNETLVRDTTKKK
jgi:uncharacterized protein (DUF697 family)